MCKGISVSPVSSAPFQEGPFLGRLSLQGPKPASWGGTGSAWSNGAGAGRLGAGTRLTWRGPGYLRDAHRVTQVLSG